MIKISKAGVLPIRQRTQFSCMAASATMCLNALGHKCNEDEVNQVMGALPTKGASWEQALATAQHYGVRSTLTVPATVRQLKNWTDAGNPVMIAWNPEGREWSHASVVFDVTEGLPVVIPPEATVTGEGLGLYVWVADSNIPNPEKLVRIVSEDVFYSKWYEKWPQYLVRRPALCLEREITPEGRQVMASSKKAGVFDWRALGSDLREAFSKTKVPTRLVTGEEYIPQRVIHINLQFGRYYFERPGWEDDAASDLVAEISLKHGLKPHGFSGNTYKTTDGRTVEIGIMASHMGGSPERLATKKTAEPYDCWNDGLRGRELAECYKFFENDLGPEDIAFVRQYFPGWSPSGGRGYAPRKPTQQIQGMGKRIRRLLMVVGTTSDTKSFRFLHDKQLSETFTVAQLRWIENLEKKYARILRDLPEDPALHVGYNQVLVDERKLTPAARVRIEKHFDIAPDKGSFASLAPKTKEPPVRVEETPARTKEVLSPAPAPTPSSRKEFEGDQLQTMVRILGVLAQRTGHGMFLGFKKDLETGKGLTEDQLKAVRNSLYKSGMRSDADHFRTASERVALRYLMAKRPQSVPSPKDKNPPIRVEAPTRRNPVVQGLIERGNAGAGKHKNKGERGSGKGSGKPGRYPKHKGQGLEHEASLIGRVSSAYLKKPFRSEIGDALLWADRRSPTPEEIYQVKATEWQDWEPHPLPEDLYRYFKRSPGSIEVKLRDLTPIRAREKGLANANKFMWLSYWGAMDTRKPVSLQDNGDGTYTVLDGNSTFANAKMSGWDKIVGVVEP